MLINITMGAPARVGLAAKNLDSKTGKNIDGLILRLPVLDLRDLTRKIRSIMFTENVGQVNFRSYTYRMGILREY